MAHFTTAARTGSRGLKWGGTILGLVLLVVGIPLASTLSRRSTAVTATAPTPQDSGQTPLDPVKQREAELKMIPRSSETVLYVELEKPVTLQLKTDEWSREIVIPQDSSRTVRFYINGEPREGYYRWLSLDGRILNILPAAEQRVVPNAGSSIANRVFRLLGKKPNQTATITTETINE